MNTALLLLLLLLVVAPGAAIVYTVERRTPNLDRMPLAGLFGDPRGRRHHGLPAASGPDSDRIDAELRVLELWHRDCA